jgi:hypothetical protein
MKDRLNSLKEFLESNLYSVVAATLIATLAIGLVTFYVGTIAPGLKNRERLFAQLEDAQKMLGTTRKIQEEPPQTLQVRLTNTQATVSALTNAFLTNDQANTMIDVLYQHAHASGVTIVELVVPSTPTPLPTPMPSQTRPIPAQTNSSVTPSKPASSSNPPSPTSTPLTVSKTSTRLPSTLSPAEPSSSQVRILRVRVQGTVRQLVDFGSRIKELSNKGVLVNSFNINGNEASVLAILNMEIALYIYSAPPTAVSATK